MPDTELELPVVAQDIPEGVCFDNDQERLTTFASFLSVLVPVGLGFTVSSSTPTVDQQNRPWVKITSDGSLVGIFTFANGAWVMPYPVAAGPNGVRWLYADTEVSLQTFDGGSAGVVSATTGPFWEVDHDWDDKIPRGATATVPVNTNDNQLSSGASATDQVRGVFWIKRTARTMKVG